MLGHVTQLVEVRAVRGDRAIGAHRDLEPGVGSELHRVELGPSQGAELVTHRRRHPLVVGEGLGRVARREGRHEPGTSLEHHLGSFRVEEGAVVDRSHTGTHRTLDALGSVRVRHHPRAEVGGRAHDRVDLVLRVVRFHRVVGRREEAATRRDLDHVGPGPDHFAHLGAHPVDAVADPRWHARVLDASEAARAAREPGVVVPPGHREHRHGDLHPRADEGALVDGGAQAGVGSRGVADGRDAERDRRAQVPSHAMEGQGEGFLHAGVFVEVLVAERQVHVAVEQPR